MHIPWKLRHRPPRNTSPGQDWLGQVVVGDPDPTSDPRAGKGDLTCQFAWDRDVSSTLVLSWCCTRKWGHSGQHLAGTGEWVAAVHSPVLPTAPASNLSA
jgi:hypothetical protein